jgi:hypothetical protein
MAKRFGDTREFDGVGHVGFFVPRRPRFYLIVLDGGGKEKEVGMRLNREGTSVAGEGMKCRKKAC